MNDRNRPVRNISDTARWVAYFRARETERADALFHDPYAARLAGERGFHIANTLLDGNRHEWAWVARTYLFDRLVSCEIQQGADLVLNLAAGLDARPYRMELPSKLQWVEVDLPEILSYKEEILAREKPRCRLERVPLDLSDVRSRRKLFQKVSERAKEIVVMSEGFLLYFSPEEVASLSSDLANETNFGSWVIDLASPGQLRLMQRTMGKQLTEGGAAFQFAPQEGPGFFARYGWEAREVRGLMRTAAELNRLPTELRSFLTEQSTISGNFPWTGICLLKRVPTP